VGPRTYLGDLEKRKFLTLPGLEFRLLCRSARSQSAVPTALSLLHRYPNGRDFVSSPQRPGRLWKPPSLPYKGYQLLLPQVESGRGVKLTTHLQLLPRSRMVALYFHSSLTSSWRDA
jgi:hypothetical protein